LTYSRLLNNISKLFSGKYVIDEQIVYVKVNKDKYFEIARYLRDKGFNRLLTVSVIDWVRRGVFEVYFLVYSFNVNAYVKVSTEIPRDKPEIESLHPIWENAAMHEREAWELFGVVFKGNPMLKPLFLEDWKELPPFRKDFDWRKYVAKEYGLRYPLTPRLIISKKK